MLIDQFQYQLPEELIATEPTVNRVDSRLLVLDGAFGAIDHRQFSDIVDLLAPGDLLVLNDTEVIPARLFGHKESGGRVEVLVERIVGEQSIVAHVRASKSPKVGSSIIIEGDYRAIISGRQEELFELTFDGSSTIMEMLKAVGNVPLPPYIKRSAQKQDKDRYQTVYARNPGAVAAPTAGLHFDDQLLMRVQNKGVNIGYTTLHVGLGTFQPVRVQNILEHHMHSERLEVSETLCQQVRATRAAGNRVIAVGTTSVRCLETAAEGELLRPMIGETDIFIYPGYVFKVVDALITNFHLPESTLLMLVSAFAGHGHIMNAYREAIEQHYRFFSYGDAMFISPKINLSETNLE
jgi:S-adenosylmethionine:tRNA ribosyltransferase-isomerase